MVPLSKSASLVIQVVDDHRIGLTNFSVVIRTYGEDDAIKDKKTAKSKKAGTFSDRKATGEDPEKDVGDTPDDIYSKGQVLKSGLKSDQPYFVRVTSKGFESQERVLTLQPGNNSTLFVMGKRGSRYYRQNGVNIPFKSSTAKLVVMRVPGPAPEIVQLSALLEKQAAFTITSMLEAPSANLKTPRNKKLIKKNPVKPWHAGFIHAELKLGERGKPRKNAIKKLHEAISKESGIGKLAVVVHESETGATLFAGEVTLTFRTWPSPVEIKALEAEYSLMFLFSESWDFHFSLQQGPDVDFDELLDRILEEQPSVIAAEPVMEAVQELDTRQVPLDYLYGLQWDHHIIQMPEAWWDLQRNMGAANQYGSNTIVIGVADPRGIEIAHPDLNSNVNGLPKIVSSFDFNGIGPVLTGTHGTSCAGAATANADNLSTANPAFREGTAGAAPGCRLVAVKVGGAALQATMYNWYIGLRVGAAPAQIALTPVDVASNSYGVPGVITASDMRFLDFSSDFGRLGRGVVACYSAGNNNTNILAQRPLAAYSRTICVTASTLSAAGTREDRAPYSNFGIEADVCSLSNDSFAPVWHQPPIKYAAVTTTVTRPVANPLGFWDGNLPGAPGLSGGATIQSTLSALTPVNQPLITLATSSATFAGTSAVLIEGVNSPTVEGLQTTGLAAAPPNSLNVQYDASRANTQQAHNAGVIVQGGAGDYRSSFGGTSYATPVTAGVVALMLSAMPTLSWVEIRHLLRTTARKVNVGETGLGGVGHWIDPSLTVPNNTVLNAAQTDIRPKAGVMPTMLTANVNAPSDPLPHRNHGTSVIRVANAAGIEVGDAIRIRQGATTEYRIVEAVNAGTNELTIEALRNNFTIGGAGTSIAVGGVKPIFSQFYGFGRINAAKAVVAARTYNHTHRDLVLRNTLTDTGLADIIAPGTQIHSPDIWLRNQNDPALPAPPYDQPGPHQNASATTNRFVYVRVKNIGTHESSLDAFVHFYVALSDHNAPSADPNANPTNITTPFLFPGDFNSATPNIIAKSWCDDANNGVSLGAPFGIISGTQKVYHVRSAAVANVFNVLIPAGAIGKADPNNINTGVTVVQMQWNQAELPPANTPFGIYLLAYVSPVDGPRQGREAGRNNNMSYREIAFADFNLLGAAGPAPLASSVNVDEFGTPVTTAFRVQMQQSIGAVNVDRMVIEISRTSDNGSVETGFYRKAGAAWQLQDAMGNTGTTAWATFTPPVLSGTANAAIGTLTAAAGTPVDVIFAGTFSAALQHHKISVRAVIHSARAGATLVPIAEESFDVQVISAVPATPSASATDPTPPDPDSFVFTDFASLTTQAAASKSYGPIDSGHFRVTSMFTAATTPKAYAVCAGVVMVQVVDANRANLILRPLRQAGLGMTPVKYYIYRGLNRADFFNATNTEVRPLAGAKDFISRLWPVFLGLNPGSPPFPAAALGFDPLNQNPTAKIDEYFFAVGSDFQYALVKTGEYMADFFNTGGSEFGFEIVLEEGTAQPTIANVQLPEYIIVATGPESNDTQRFTKRLKREEILNYLDPAAFYGMHHAGTVRRKPTGTWTGNDIITNVVDKFFTRRKVYIDIRNENGNSYNFYRNYTGPAGQPDTGLNIKTGAVAASLTTAAYGTSDWPLQIITLSHTTPNPVNPLIIHLRWNDNPKPVLYIEHGTITSGNLNGKFADETHLFNQPPPYTQGWTNAIAFTSPNVVSGANKVSIAWLIKLHYSLTIDASVVWPATVVKTDKTTDNLFGPIDLEAPWGVITEARWIAAQDRKYVDGQALNFGQMMERGVAYEGTDIYGRVIFYAALIDQHKNPIAAFTPRRGITGGVSDGVSFLQAARNFDQYRLEFGSVMDGATPITTIRFVPGTVVNAASSNGIMFLGISAAQLTALQALAGLNNAYPRTVFIEEMGALGAGKKYKIGVHGLAADGAYLKVMPTVGNDIFVYSMEGLYFYSDDFSNDEPLPTTYSRNVEESVGVMNMPLVGSVSFPINGLTQGANGNFRVAGDLTQRISRGGTFQVAANPANNGTYTVTAVTYAMSANITTLQVANVPGASTSGSLQIMPRTIEEHFIHMDPTGAIGATSDMETILTSFQNAVNAVPNNTTSNATLQGIIDNFGLQILARARAAVRNSNHANPDDRPLYWARLKMLAILKSHEYLLQNVADAAALVKRLEERSRGISPTAPSFAGAGANKKALIIGFDPFFVVPGQPNNNSHQSNPSGVAALFLHAATEIPGMFIQSVIVPVRYEDLDAGMIDNLVDPFLNGATAVDMIMTISQDIDLRFHVDRFGTRYRTPTTPDNSGVVGKTPVHYELNAAHTALIRLASNAGLPHYLETMLPASNMVPGAAMAVAATGTQVVKTVIFDQKFTPLGGVAVGDDAISTFSATVPPAGVEIGVGSGGNYLSNEIFYRVAWRRTQRSSTINTGHLHVPKLQQGTPPSLDALFDPSRFKYYVDTIIQILKDALPGI